MQDRQARNGSQLKDMSDMIRIYLKVRFRYVSFKLLPENCMALYSQPWRKISYLPPQLGGRGESVKNININRLKHKLMQDRGGRNGSQKVAMVNIRLFV